MKKILKYVLAVMVVLAVGYFLFVYILVNAEQASLNTVNLNTKNQNINSANLFIPKPAINAQPQNVASNPPSNTKQPAAGTKNLNKLALTVPYLSESPDNTWTGPWKNACEEASIAMVDGYYYGKSSITITAAKQFMTMLFNVQNKIWGGNANSDAARTAQLINDNSIYNASIIAKPTISQIKKELLQSHPVIVPLYGFDLHNKNIPFVPAPRGTSYHMFVIIGYDDTTKEFITNDPGDTKEGAGHRYGYDLLMNAIHDYSYVTRHADGPARAIFTYPQLVKLAGSPKVYYLHDNIKQWVTDEATFKAKGWTWDMVNLADKVWLDSFKIGSDIKAITN